MSLYIKYRPKTLDEIRGNQEVVSALNGLLKNKETFPHTLLFYGNTGCGKTTFGRIVGTEIGCKGNDFREVNSADFRGIDTIRDIIKQSQFLPMEGPVRVWLIDEVHKLTNDAQNALLKILEDTPRYVYFILCTTDPQKLLPTIKGRCSQFQVKPLNESQMYGLIRRIIREEGEALEKEVIDQIIETSLGHPRNALQILEQVLSVPNEERLEISKRNIDNQTEIINLCRALIKNAGWREVSKILTGLKELEPESIRRVVLGYCQAILLKESNNTAAAIIEAFWEPTYDIGFPGVVYACYSVTKN